MGWGNVLNHARKGERKVRKRRESSKERSSDAAYVL